MSQHLVFVYGSLKKGFHNHHFMGDADFVSEARTRDPVWLLHQFNSKTKPGAYVPGVEDKGDGYIKGEIYQVDDEGLKKLDRLEENGTRYCRRQVCFEGGLTAWMYTHADKAEAPAPAWQQIDFDKSARTYMWKP